MQPATIDGEAIDHDDTADHTPAVREPDSAGSLTLFQTDDPVEVIERASRTATALADVVKQQRLATNIQGREHVRVEGWTLLGSMLGVFPVVVWSRPVMQDGQKVGWEARVEARTRDGAIVGAAEAECLVSESTWKNRDDYARRSMAQTRATSKAMRGPLGFVMTLAGFSATPAEEMPAGGAVSPQDTPPTANRAATPPTAPKPISNPQKAKISILKDKLIAVGLMDEEKWRKALTQEFGTDTITALTWAQAAGLIDRLIAAEERFENQGVDLQSLWTDVPV